VGEGRAETRSPLSARCRQAGKKTSPAYCTILRAGRAARPLWQRYNEECRKRPRGPITKTVNQIRLAIDHQRTLSLTDSLSTGRDHRTAQNRTESDSVVGDEVVLLSRSTGNYDRRLTVTGRVCLVVYGDFACGLSQIERVNASRSHSAAAGSLPSAGLTEGTPPTRRLSTSACFRQRRAPARLRLRRPLKRRDYSGDYAW